MRSALLMHSESDAPGKKNTSSSSLYSGLITYTLVQLKLPLDDMESFLI